MRHHSQILFFYDYIFHKVKKKSNQTKENNYYKNSITAFACHIETSYVINFTVNEVSSRTNYLTYPLLLLLLSLLLLLLLLLLISSLLLLLLLLL